MQFLPQDKVVEFAKLKPGQLLEETEKAIGDSTLFTLHQELIRERNELQGIETVSSTFGQLAQYAALDQTPAPVSTALSASANSLAFYSSWYSRR